MKKPEVSKWIKSLEAHRKSVGEERDKLRETMDEMEMLHETCEDAYDNIGYAIDRLSELA